MEKVTSQKALKAIAALKANDLSGQSVTRGVCYRVGREYHFLRDVAYEGTHTLRFPTLNAALQFAADEAVQIARADEISRAG